MMRRTLIDTVERRRRVHVPKYRDSIWARRIGNGAFEFGIEDADAARLDQQIAFARSPIDRHLPALVGCRVDHYARPFGIGDVAMLLAFVGVRFIKRDLVA